MERGSISIPKQMAARSVEETQRSQQQVTEGVHPRVGVVQRELQQLLSVENASTALAEQVQDMNTQHGSGGMEYENKISRLQSQLAQELQRSDALVQSLDAAEKRNLALESHIAILTKECEVLRKQLSDSKVLEQEICRLRDGMEELELLALIAKHHEVSFIPH